MRKLLSTSLARLLLLPGLPLSADDAPSASLRERDRVRVRAPGVADTPIAGRLLRVDQGALVVTRDDGAVVDVPRSAIEEMEVARGPRSNARKGALLGDGAGAAVVFLATAADGGCDPDLGGCGLYFVGGAVSAAFGALVGAGIGSLVKRDRWVKLDPGEVGRGDSHGPGCGLEHLDQVLNVSCS